MKGSWGNFRHGGARWGRVRGGRSLLPTSIMPSDVGSWVPGGGRREPKAWGRALA